MNSATVRRLRRKFIFTATLTYFLVMIFMGFFINTSNIVLSLKQIHAVLDYIVSTEGTMVAPDRSAGSDGTKNGSDAETVREANGADTDNGEDLDDFSPEFRLSTRYFAVFYESDRQTVSDVIDSHISEISEEKGIRMADRVIRQKISFGRTGVYFWETGRCSDGRYIAAFVNCQSQISSIERILRMTLWIAVCGMGITFLLVNIFSSRIIRPELENIRRQKQFITNASHELKTPLAVIRANTEIEEMMNGENEWTQSTMRQVDRLNGLVQNLVMIARAQEREDRSVMTEINVSTNVEETVKPYESLAQQDKKKLVLEIEPDIRMLADESRIRQLASLLIDNAFKYCDDGGTVIVSLSSLHKGKQVRLVISNSFRSGADLDYSRFFERFYRQDESHNVDKGGYGIGLSIAESIVQQYGGSISVSWKDGMISFTCLLQ